MLSPALDLRALERSAAETGIPLLDVLLIAANSEGAASSLGHRRARMQLRPQGSDEAWQVILPLGNDRSAFHLDESGLSLNGRQMAELVTIENDDVVLTYLRGGSRSLTLNTHSRSTCTGCVFCPNVIEDASDNNLGAVEEFERLFTWVEADNGWEDLGGLEVITVCSGCFNRADAAIDHMAAIRRAATPHGFTGRLHLLSSVVRDASEIEALAEQAGPFHLTLTLECFTRRELLLKDSKASLTIDKAVEILDVCASNDVLGDFTYVAGLDPFDAAVDGLRRLTEHVTAFPRVQVYQAHNDLMRRARNREAEDLSYYLRLRTEIEPYLAERGLTPVSWQNYRPLWYSVFADGQVPGPRV